MTLYRLALEQLAHSARDVLLEGPSTLAPIERRARFGGAALSAMPPRAAACLQRFVTAGDVHALLDVSAWCESALASTCVAAAPASSALAPIAARSPEVLRASMDDDPFERWLSLASVEGPLRAEAAARLCSSDPVWLDRTLFARVDERAGVPPWLEPVLRRLRPTPPLDQRLLQWLEREPEGTLASALTLALSRAADRVGDRLLSLAPRARVAWDDASRAVYEALDVEPAVGVGLALRWIVEGLAIERAAVQRAIDRAPLCWRDEFAALARMRLAAVDLHPWEIEALERLVQRSRA